MVKIINYNLDFAFIKMSFNLAEKHEFKMSEENQFQYSQKVLNVPLMVLFVMWFVYWCEYKFEMNISHFGILPRELIGLRGVLFSPFIHSGIKHLFNNSIPIIVFLGMLYYF